MQLMASGQKILLLDDEQELLDSYGDLLRTIPSLPEVHTCSSGAQALALLESETFSLLITDLMMPKMDGLQVLSITQRKFPQLRTVVLTCVSDEQYRVRAYAMGVELVWQKPSTSEEIKLFQECIESLLAQQTISGFRGMQSKSLIDLLQLESLSQSSVTLRIIHGAQEGRIWLNDGSVFDAQSGSLAGEDAFREIFSWKSGHFEILPADPSRPRKINSSCQGLLLDSAQALDEAKQSAAASGGQLPSAPSSVLAPLARFEGVEFVLSIAPDQKFDSWSLENAESLVRWARETYQRLIDMGVALEIGEMIQIQGLGMRRHIALSGRNHYLLCVGFHRILTIEQVHQTMKEITTKWAS